MEIIDNIESRNEIKKFKINLINYIIFELLGLFVFMITNIELTFNLLIALFFAIISIVYLCRGFLNALKVDVLSMLFSDFGDQTIKDYYSVKNFFKKK